MNRSVEESLFFGKGHSSSNCPSVDDGAARACRKRAARFAVAFAWTFFGLVSGVVGMGLVLYFARISLPSKIVLGEIASYSTVFSSVSVVWTLMLRKRDLTDGAAKIGALCAIVMLFIGSGLVVSETIPEMPWILDDPYYDIICFAAGIFSLLVASTYSGIVDGMER